MAAIKKSQGFTIIEVLIASAIGLITLGVIYGAYQAGWGTFQFNQKRMEVINKLSLSMDRIKKEARQGKEFILKREDLPSKLSTSIPSDNGFLALTTNDTTIAFYLNDDKTHLYKGVYKEGADSIEETVIVSFDPKIFSGVNLKVSDISDSFAKIELTASWSYRKQPKKEKKTSSKVHLRNWGRS